MEGRISISKRIINIGLAAVAFLLASCPHPAFAAGGKWQDFARIGGQQVRVGGITSTLAGSATYFQRICTSTSVRVKNVGTQVDATIYTDAALSVSQSQPFNVDSTGFGFFYANASTYDIYFTGCGTAWTLFNVVIPGDTSSALVLGDNQGTSVGTIYKGTLSTPNRFIHNYYPATISGGGNTFAGKGSGNFTMTTGMAITSVGCINDVNGNPTTTVCNLQSPLTLSTANPHGLFVGAVVTITGVLGDTAANGTWSVSAINPFVTPAKFSIAVTGNGTYSSGGSFTWIYQSADNTCVGGQCMANGTTPIANSGIGFNFLNSCTTCWSDNGVGVDVMSACTTCYENFGGGNETLSACTSCHDDTGIGAGTLNNCTTCTFSTAVGADSLQGLISGTSDSAFGTNSCNFCTGGNMLSLGAGSATNATTASQGTFVGTNSKFTTPGAPGQFNTAGCISYGCEVDQGNTFTIGGTSTLAVNVGIGGVTRPTQRIAVVGGSGFGGLDLIQSPATTASDIACVQIWNDSLYATSPSTSTLISNAPGRKASICGHVYGTAASIGLDFYTNRGDSTPIKAISLQIDGQMVLAPIAFAALGTFSTPQNGQFTYCSDCTVTTPGSCTNVTTVAACTCIGSGTGAFAKRLNGVWLCN